MNFDGFRFDSLDASKIYLWGDVDMRRAEKNSEFNNSWSSKNIVSNSELKYKGRLVLVNYLIHNEDNFERESIDLERADNLSSVNVDKFLRNIPLTTDSTLR